MSLEILEKVKEFLIRLVKDEGFRTQLMSEKIDEVRKVIEDGGYNFSQEEFETATIKILELKELGEFHELSEEELVGAVGGITNTDSASLPFYKIIFWPPKGHPLPRPLPQPLPKPWPQPQPMYGIIINPLIDAQPLSGVITDERLTS